MATLANGFQTLTYSFSDFVVTVLGLLACMRSCSALDPASADSTYLSPLELTSISLPSTPRLSLPQCRASDDISGYVSSPITHFTDPLDMHAVRPIMIGRPPNFWLFSERDGFDLTRSLTRGSLSARPSLTMQTSKCPIIIAPEKTALVVIDMQNFFLSPAMGREPGPGLAAQQALLSHAIPAARRAAIRILWLGWGVSDQGLLNLTPMFLRNFGFTFQIPPSSIGKSNELHNQNHPNQEWRQQGGGFGSQLGNVTLENGDTVDAGRMLMRDQWNTALHGPLQQAFIQGASLDPPDVKFHKESHSGFWGGNTDFAHYLKEHNISTLLFAGVNTDQCVLANLQEAGQQGYDTILLKDACGTTSPDSARQMVEFNSEKAFGFLSSCEQFYKGAFNMKTPDKVSHVHSSGTSSKAEL